MTGVSPSIEEVREELRRRGYLHGGLSSWVAAGRGGAASRLRQALRAGVRVGLVGGPILAAPAAAALVMAGGAEPTVRGAAQVWMALALLLAASLALLECGADLILSWLAGRGVILLGRIERLAGRVGLLFAAAASIYLLIYARGGRTSGSGAWLLWVAVLLASLAAGHVVGRLTRLRSIVTIATSLAGFPEAAAAGGDLAGKPGGSARGARRRAAIGAGWVAALLAGAALLFIPAGDRTMIEEGEGAPAPIQPLPTPGRVLLLGIDGLDGAILEGAAAGPGPISRFVAGAARRDLLSTEPPAPPLRWTTIATGRPSAQHGVVGYQAGRLPGIPVTIQEPAAPSGWVLSPRLLLPPRVSGAAPVSSHQRRAAAVWEILGSHGVTAAAVGWWATWPAASHAAPAARVVGDRAFPRLLAGRPPDRDAAPGGLQDEVHARFPEDLAAARAAVRQAGLSEAGAAGAGALADAWNARVGLRMWRSGEVRVTLVYLPALDIARRAEPDSSSGVLAGLAPVLEEAMRESDPGDLVLIVGDPGRGAAPEGPRGVMLAWGGRAVPGTYPPASLEDIAPTLLALAGLPAALDMPGRPVLDFLTPDDPARHPLPPIPAYRAAPVVEEENNEDPFDEELLDRLRSLGYIR